LDAARSNIQALEEERSYQQRAAGNQVDEAGRLSVSLSHQKRQLSSLQMEVDERRQAEAEQREFLDRAMTDIEALRADLMARDEEVERLRDTLSTMSSSMPSGSLNEEMLNAYQQQHELELSSAQSQIRALELRAYEADDKAHSLQRHASALEDELTQLRAASQNGSATAYSPTSARPASRGHGDDLRRTSMMTARRPTGLSTGPPRSSLDYSLSPETRHKRRISLIMLKARMESERATAMASAPPSRMMSPAIPHLHKHSSTLPKLIEPDTGLSKRSHFLDESHIFWCHSCRGDLVIL
jgi:hypothetical protein